MATPLETGSSLELLRRVCDDLARSLDASGCALSRVIGDLLVEVAEDASAGPVARIGRGYLVSDFPATEAVLRTCEPLALSTEDDACDRAEAAVLEELGYASLLMLPFVSGGAVWGLVEVYGPSGRRFSPDDAARATEILREAGIELERRCAA